MHVQQGPHRLPLQADQCPAELPRLLRRAGAVARAKASLAGEEGQLKAAFDRLRPALEAQHGLAGSYGVVGEGGQIHVSLGEEFVLNPDCGTAEALQQRLEALGHPELLGLFKLQPQPDQRAIKQQLAPPLLAVGSLRPRRPLISLRRG